MGAGDGQRGEGDVKTNDPTDGLKAAWDRGRGGPGVDFRKEVHGIVPGDTGHVPRAIHKYGASAMGQTPPFETSR